ncbi:SycD/LcrH family type III secretion system chaperone [Aeromonas jandaei]|uniref:SycD/LcrH family type III secretion system chaperone n=1 Tax=Aeromonas jandaei TaxID=650 RepID=UPI001115B001|nr:SycD/LcrH family type III secretion system chaperone [Aeromonas jandaei]TNH94874.1 CesD/SycD/LcrH family type III secretion system chaperone [Aeromonas jandaei]
MKAQRNDDVDNLEAVRNYFNQGGTLHALMDVSLDDLDVIYAYACQLFKSADYPAAKRYYMLLTNLCHWQYDYWLALGLCCQRLDEHDEAIFSLVKAAQLRLDDPQPVYLAGISYRLIGNLEQAHKAFQGALKWCSNKSQYDAIKTEVLYQLSLMENM